MRFVRYASKFPNYDQAIRSLLDIAEGTLPSLRERIDALIELLEEVEGDNT